MVREGEEVKVKNVIIRIQEVLPYFDFTNKRCLMIGYVIIDGSFQTDLAHVWIPKNADVRPELEKVVNKYLQQTAMIRRVKI